MASAPLTNALIQRINIAERRMLRLLVGWVRVDRENWPDTWRRMRTRVDRVLEKFPLRHWHQEIYKRQWILAYRCANMDEEENWCAQAVLWDPTKTQNSEHNPRRKQGRPLRKWDDSLNRFCFELFGDVHWTTSARQMTKEQWMRYQKEYLEFCEWL